MEDIRGNELAAGQSIEYQDFGKCIGRIEHILTGQDGPVLVVRHPDGEKTLIGEVEIAKLKVRRR